jgi:hypothetical protein
MSLDKFVMRGFSGSTGSGEGRWVASSSAQSNSSINSGSRAQSGSSFVMGGGGLRPRPTTSSPRGGGRSSEHDGSRGEASGGGDRYSFNVDKVRNKGAEHKSGQHQGCFGRDGRSLNELASTQRGHRIVVGLAMYGIGLFILIFLLVAFLGAGKNDDYYELPGTSKKARPMWSNSRNAR